MAIRVVGHIYIPTPDDFFAVVDRRVPGIVLRTQLQVALKWQRTTRHEELHNYDVPFSWIEPFFSLCEQRKEISKQDYMDQYPVHAQMIPES